MSNPRYNTQTANTREASNKKIGSYGRGQNDIPTAVEAAAVTTKGIAPAKGKAQDITPEGVKAQATSGKGQTQDGKVSGTKLGMGAATKGGKYTWS